MMNRPTITLAGMGNTPPGWVESLCEKLSPTADCRREDERAHYVPRLVDSRSALVIANGDAGGWRFWTATPKSSPATRRIPIFLVTNDDAVRQSALRSGADLVLTPVELIAQCRKLLADYARVPDPAQVEDLGRACQQPLPELAVQAIDKFNAGEYYAQHDLFEELWMATDGPVRDLYRAVLQVGIAYYQILRGNHRGARKMLLRGKQWLAVLPDQCQGIDVKALREDSHRVRAALDRLAEDQIDQFDTALLQPVKMVDQQ
jgi:predicted metal-dependent hydrolase